MQTVKATGEGFNYDTGGFEKIYLNGKCIPLPLLILSEELFSLVQRRLDIDHPNVKWTKEEKARSISKWKKEARAALTKAGA